MKREIRSQNVRRERVRQIVLVIWTFGVLACCIIYAIKFSGYTAWLFPEVDTRYVVYSMSSVFGLLVPQLTMILTFILGGEIGNDEVIVDRGRALIICAFTAIYQIVLVGLVALGVLSFWFDPNPNGEALTRNTSIVVALAGLLSFMATTPVNLLFRR